MVLSFLDYEGIDPVESPRAAAAALASAKDYFNKTGGKAFLFHADSVDEFDVRAEVEGVAELLNVAGNGLGDDGRDKLLASLRREYVADKDPCGGCPKGEKCVCTHKGCHCEKTASVKEANKYIEQRGDEWVILQKGTGKVLSHHDSKAKAEASFRAMEMNKHGHDTDPTPREGHVHLKTAHNPSNKEDLHSAAECPICHPDLEKFPTECATCKAMLEPQHETCPVCNTLRRPL